MAFEVPTDLIRDVQILLRKNAGLATYDPEDSSLPSLPSLEDSIAGFEPSPPNLRCKTCKGRLLRGLQSVICVYCGEEQSKEVPPEPINFKSTVGYRWLLESLRLDGSETAGPSIDAPELRRGHRAQEDEISLSDLLNLEIKWPAESQKVNTTLKDQGTDQIKTALNLVGVNLDNYFSKAKENDVINPSEEQLGPNSQFKSRESSAVQGHENLSLFENVVQPSQIGSRESSAVQGHENLSMFENVVQPSQIKNTKNSEVQGYENLSLFENVQPSEIEVTSKEDERVAPDSGWDAEFQSASTGALHQDSNSVNSFVGSSVDLSVHLDTVFGPGKYSKDDSAPCASTTSDLIPTTSDLIQDDLWKNSNAGVSNQVDPFETTFNLKDSVIANSTSNTTTSIDWIQDDLLQSSNTNKATDNKEDDPFGVWNDFTSSTSGHEPSNSSPKQTGDHVSSSPEINLFSSTNDSQDMDFGSFSQPDPFSGAFSSSAEVHNLALEASVSDRMADGNAGKDGEIFEQTGKDATTKSKADDVEMVMSQMHDLSFMLESNLSIPKNLDESRD